MISRKTAKNIAELYHDVFYRYQTTFGPGGPERIEMLDTSHLYDYLYEHNYEAWFLNATKKLYIADVRALKEFIMGLHTGEAVVPATPNWTLSQRTQLGQRLLKNLAEDMLMSFYNKETGGFGSADQLKSELELDGYIFKEGKLYFSEAAVLDTEGEVGILEKLAQEADLENQTVIKHHLDLSEKHFLESKWDDSIANSRKFLESVLQEIASKHHQTKTGTPINKDTYEWAGKVRNYLESVGLFATKEKDATASIYQLLSETGSHPYIAEKDQARLMRYLALTFSQFALLRFQGYLQSKNTNG